MRPFAVPLVHLLTVFCEILLDEKAVCGDEFECGCY